MKTTDKSIMFWYGLASNGSNKFPVVTIASRINSDGTVNRGIAILSANDNPSKSIGRKQALRRLLLAETRKMNCSPINLMSNKIIASKFKEANVPQWEFKAQYHVPMERIEDRVFNNPNKKPKNNLK